jgi:hypothetical protein
VWGTASCNGHCLCAAFKVSDRIVVCGRPFQGPVQPGLGVIHFDIVGLIYLSNE